MADDTFDDDFLDFEMNAADLSMLDKFIEDSSSGKAKPVLSRAKTVQTTLDGRIAQQPVASSSKPRSTTLTGSGSSTTLMFGHKIPKTKKWDHTEFAKSGWKRLKGKGKEREADDAEDDGDEDEEVEFEQFPAPSIEGKLLFTV
jgi:ATP-dependent DNA helicase MPH1